MRAAVVGVVVGALAIAVFAARQPARPDSVERAQARAPVAEPPSVATTGSISAEAARTVAGPLRYLAIGGGALPENTEVSLEQDLALVEAVLPGPGRLLFGGGAGTRSVRVADTSATRADDLRLRLGELFAPRPGRRSRYRETVLAHAGAASLTQVQAELGRALSYVDAGPLLLFIATHGEQRETPAKNRVVLWGDEGLTARDLSALHDGHPRPLRVVVTSCFSGGFGELAFRGADTANGATTAPRCGLFAGTWDRQTSGCDPNPDRREQESYGLHMLNALRGRGRAGQPLPLAELDYDGDGQVGLLDAHTRARIAAQTIDVPTTTSEHFLRQVQHAHGHVTSGVGPAEDAAVLAQLGAALGVVDAQAAQAELEAVRARLDALDEDIAAAEAEADGAYATLSTAILGRYPELDDPYHPHFETSLAGDRDALTRLLDDGPGAAQLHAADATLARLDDMTWHLQIEEARLMRYLRADETLKLVSALQTRGGEDWETYQRLLSCERSPLQAQ